MKETMLGVKTFSLPAQDEEASAFIQRKDITILINERYPCPRDGVILLHLQYSQEFTE